MGQTRRVAVRRKERANTNSRKKSRTNRRVKSKTQPQGEKQKDTSDPRSRFRERLGQDGSHSGRHDDEARQAHFRDTSVKITCETCVEIDY